MHLERVDKLSLGIPNVSNLIYVPGNFQGNHFDCGSIPAAVQPTIGIQADFLQLAN